VLNLPEWAKFSAAVIAGTIAAMVWMQSNFVSQIQYSTHAVQNAVDMERLTQAQRQYAIQEKETASNLSDINGRLEGIETNVGWLRDYLDISKPLPRRNGKKP
jgi:ketopantoate hydroxymethyltransferase